VAEDLREVARDQVVDRIGPDEAPSVDPDAVRHSYYLHRARRKARIEHRRRTRRAGARFWVVFLVLIVVFVFLALTTWREIGRLFGL
jgi:hypothetical protein